ncbi:MAG TPA: class I SAM-dependent methyltransferase [Bacteroidia bacterium]|nr:class I SAM-dependent methyltransferase [Bacteroidia bacterium]
MEHPAFDYEQSGLKYTTIRRTDPDIETIIHRELGDARNILNVGAGAGSYEPADKDVISVEPSASMREQRLKLNRKAAIDAKADALPFGDNSFDASMALLTVHHWPDIEKGLRELQRVSKDRIVIMTFDPKALDSFWNVNYFPQLIDVERERYPDISLITSVLAPEAKVIPIPVSLNCLDGFQEAYFGRPEEFLKAEVRRAQSAWGFLPDGLEEKYVRALKTELDSGEWDRKFGHYRKMPSATFALRLIVSRKQN